jgi:hypothetical protein
MLESRLEFFRANMAECYGAAETAKDPAIKQAYRELAQGWCLLADMFERFGWHPGPGRPFRMRALPRRALDQFYELRTEQKSKPRRRARSR